MITQTFSFTVYVPLKMLFSYFQKFDLSNFKMTFAKKFYEKGQFLWQISKVLKYTLTANVPMQIRAKKIMRLQ